jgi:2-polyprenyl-6-methoxyphenol hydroxylase-like FAD-dependent oxidoreductase
VRLGGLGAGQQGVSEVIERVVVIGGGVAGLGVAIGLANRGIPVTVLERDPGAGCATGEAAFNDWRRPGVSQFRHAHGFSARARNLMLEHAPEVVEDLLADGVEVVNFFKMLAPRELWTEADDAYGSLWTRRPGFELALRRHAERVAEVRSPVAVAGLTFGEGFGHPRRVTGVRLADGTEIAADLTVDAGGRRSPVPRWLNDSGIGIGLDEQDCDIVYFTRYYRRNPSGLPALALVSAGAGITDRLGFNTFTGDHDTYALLMVCAANDRPLFQLREPAVFEAIAGQVGMFAPWVDAENGTPLHSPEMMSGNRNRRWRYLAGGEPAVLGLLPVGDALCSTNPFYGWGASLALTHAFAAAGAIAEHGLDLRDTLEAYEARIGTEADEVYRESSADDRFRIYKWRRQAPPDWDRDEMERRDLVRCIAAGATKDPVLGRAFLRRVNLLESPAKALADPQVVEHARNTQRILAGKASRRVGPEGGEIEELIKAAHASD